MKYGRISILASLFLVIMQICVFADFKKNEPVTVYNADGTTLEAYVTGDEYVSVLHDADGYVLVKADTGNYEYAVFKDGVFSPCGDEKGTNYSELPEEYFIAEREKVFDRMEEAGFVVPSRSVQLASGNVTEFKGEGTIIVVPIAFAGGKTDYAGITQRVEEACEYYSEVSYGNVSLTSHNAMDGYGLFVSEQPEMYYHVYNEATNPIGYDPNGDERYDRELDLVAQALGYYGFADKAIDEPVDVNGDGMVDFLVFVYDTEYESEWNTLLWAHHMKYGGAVFNILGKGVNRWIFLPISERSETLCHEMYHAMGANDLYSYSNGANYVGMWDIMDVGNGTMLTYMKHQYGGWISEIPELCEAGTYTINPAHMPDNNCYKIPIDEDEYYVVEYRSRYSGKINYLDRYRRWQSEGLLVTRVYSPRSGLGNMEATTYGTEIIAVPHMEMGTACILGAAFPEFSPTSGHQRTLLTADEGESGVDDKTVIKNIRENEDGTLSFDLSFDGAGDTVYEGIYGLIVKGYIENGLFGLYAAMATYDEDGNPILVPMDDLYDVEYAVITNGNSSANVYEFTKYTEPFSLSGASIILAYITDENGTRVAGPDYIYVKNVVTPINTALDFRDTEFSSSLLGNPDYYKVGRIGFYDGDEYTTKLHLDGVVTINVDGTVYEFLSEDLKGNVLGFAADNVSILAGDGSELKMSGLAYHDSTKYYVPAFYKSISGRASLFESAETVDAGDSIVLSVLGDFDGEIHYTTDGTAPTTESPVYDAPITVNEDTVIRAAYFLENGNAVAGGVNVFVREEYREYSAEELNRIFKNSSSPLPYGEGKYVKVCYSAGEGSLVLRDSDWMQYKNIENPTDDGVIYINASEPVYVQEASGDVFSVSTVDKNEGVDLSIIRHVDGSGMIAVHSFEDTGDFELVVAEYDGDRLSAAANVAAPLSAGSTGYLPFSGVTGALKAFCFDSLEGIKPAGRCVLSEAVGDTQSTGTTTNGETVTETPEAENSST